MDEKDMEKDILISIIIPVYNAEEFLTQCLDSICGQTYKNIEVILIDDGSTDGTKKICMNYLEKDNRIRYLYKKNEGPGIARNKGLEMANGQYIMFVDSDDYFYSPDNVDIIIRRIRKNQADLIMYNSGTYWNEDGEFVREGVIIEEKEIDRLKNSTELLLTDATMIQVGNNDDAYWNGEEACEALKKILTQIEKNKTLLDQLEKAQMKR